MVTKQLQAANEIGELRTIAELQWRHRARVRGRVRSLRIQPWAGTPTLEAVLDDNTGGVRVVFLGRRSIAGVELGRIVEVEGMVGARDGHFAILNPRYWLRASF